MYKITCCHHCSEREIGCHAHCRNYFKEKMQYESDKKKIKEIQKQDRLLSQNKRMLTIIRNQTKRNACKSD